MKKDKTQGVNSFVSSAVYSDDTGTDSDGALSAPSSLRSNQFSVMSDKVMDLDRSSRTKKKLNKKLAELTINKLKIQSIGLIGREEEIEVLLSRLRRSVIESASNQLSRQPSKLIGTTTGGSIIVSNTNHGSVSSAIKSVRATTTTRSNRPASVTIISTRPGSVSIRTTSSGSRSSRMGSMVSKTKKELVFIKGFSGVGKTSLARAVRKELKSFQKEMKSPHKGFYAEGKFDLNSRDEPYSGIAKAYSELIWDILRTDRDMLLGIGKKLCAVLGADVEPLTSLIPELEDVVSKYKLSNDVKVDNKMEGMQDRWKYTFRILTRLLTDHVKPLVIMIDDLQWADKGSLDLIDWLISDSHNVNPLVIIGCYRSNEVSETSDFSKKVKSLKDKKSDYGFDITEITVKSCGVKEVNQMIMKMMDTDDESRTRDLAKVCFQRTLGNPFFVIEFMSMLQREELITFNIGTMKWIYDVSKIEDATMSTANVVEMVQSRMQKMPDDVQLLLSVAGCLGPSFRVPILELVWRSLSNVVSRGFEQDKVPALVEFIECEMLIEACSESKYRWVHDKVQEAALSLAVMNKDALKFEMGKILFVHLDEKELDEELFDVADLICCGQGEKSVDFAYLCMKAAKKARRLSAFEACLIYIQNGIGMLPSDMWIQHQSLTLEFFTLGAQLQLALGDFEGSKKFCSTVMNRKDIAVSAKIPLRLVEIERLLTVEMRYGDAIKNCLALLKDLEFKFCWHRSLMPLQALFMLNRTINAIKRQPKDFHLQLGRMDEQNGIISDILMRISYASKHIQDMMQVAVCHCHIANLTLQHGLCEYSAPSFSLIGSLAVHVFKTHNDVPRFREISLSTQSHFGRARAPLTMYTTYSYTLGWTLRLDVIAEPLFQSYIQGIQNGEVNIAMQCLTTYCVHLPYCLGKPIDQILVECPGVLMQMEEFSLKSQTKMINLFFQMCVNLQSPEQGCSPSLLKGEVHSIEKCDGDILLLAWHDFAECQLLLFYDDPSAADRALKSALVGVSPGYFARMIEYFHRGISLYVAARRTKRRKYKQQAKKLRKILLKLKKGGNPNVVYYCDFLDAEHAALNGKYDEAEKNYKKAIKTAARSGHLHHAALFNELYSDFLLRERCDKEEARYRLEEAIRFYGDWGAFGKVEQLEKSNLLK